MEGPMRRTFDLRLQLPNHAILVGASMSGKTRLALRLLEASDKCMNPAPKSVVFFYDQWQDQYLKVKETLAQRGVEMKLFQGGQSVTIDQFQKHDHQTLIVIDDASEETSSSAEIAKIVTNGRHKNLSIWLIWHSLFSKHPASRIISQNVGYMFFLASARLMSQVHTLDSQLSLRGALVGAYAQVTDEEDWDKRYLLLDLATTTPPTFRLRSQVHQPHVQSAFLH